MEALSRPRRAVRTRLDILEICKRKRGSGAAWHTAARRRCRDRRPRVAWQRGPGRGRGSRRG